MTPTTTTTTGALALIIDVDSAARTERIASTDWQTVGAIVGGWLEEISGTYEGDAWAALCDEEGQLKRLDVNAGASALAREIGWRFSSHGALVGTVVFLGRVASGDLADVPASVTGHARAIGILSE